MNLRWLLFDYADPALQLSFRQRMKIQFRRVPIRELSGSMMRRRIAGGLLIALPLMAMPMLVMYLGFQSTTKNQEVGIWLFPAMMAPLIIANWIWISLAGGLIFRREYYYRIRLEGYDLCLGCGYWLRGLDDSTKKCPECGSQREPIADKCESN